MITEFLQEIIKQFSSRVLYLEMCWFATFGYVAHVIVVTALTKLPLKALPKSIAQLHFASMGGSYLIAPELAAFSSILSKFYSYQYQSWFVGQQIYVWYMVCMMFISSFLLCRFFVTVTCIRFKVWLISMNGVVGLLGFFVLKAMNFLTMN